MTKPAKQKMLIVELWGVGDLIIGTPFLQKVSEKYDVTILAKPFAADLQARFWPTIKVIPFGAPWTAFKFGQKYRLHAWPWRAIFRVVRTLHREHFDVALSARPGDPRDHLLLRLSGAAVRLGFPRVGSQVLLTRALVPPGAQEHRYENWRVIARALKLDLEPRDRIHVPPRPPSPTVLVHTGAAQPVRVWPLDRYKSVVAGLRGRGYQVKVVCNPEQREWWEKAGETEPAVPRTITELLRVLDEAGVFIGNDSGPGHLAAICGVPTFTLFGPQVPEWFAPLHPAAEIIEGKACPFKPCFDACRFPAPHCLLGITEAEVWAPLLKFVERHLGTSGGSGPPIRHRPLPQICE
jgi:heptosyltransferase-2